MSFSTIRFSPFSGEGPFLSANFYSLLLNEIVFRELFPLFMLLVSYMTLGLMSYLEDNPRGARVINISIDVGVIDTFAVFARLLARWRSKVSFALDGREPPLAL